MKVCVDDNQAFEHSSSIALMAHALGEYVQGITPSRSTLSSVQPILKSRETNLLIRSQTASTKTGSPTFWSEADNSTLHKTWPSILAEKMQPFRAFHGTARLFLTIHAKHFALNDFDYMPLMADTQDEAPGLGHRAIYTGYVHEAAAEVIQGLCEALRACQENNSLDVPLDMASS